MLLAIVFGCVLAFPEHAAAQSTPAQPAPRVLLVTSSRDYLNSRNKPAGYPLVEAVRLWDAFQQAGYTVEFASRNGGRAAADTTGVACADSAALRFFASEQAMAALNASIAIAQVDTAAYDIVVFLGGHPALWDFLEDPLFSRLAGIAYERGGIVATLGQGAAVLLTTTLRNGASIVSRARLTCTSDEEEDAGGFQYDIPYYLETALRRGGAIHYRDAANVPNVVAEDRLITGQNSESVRWLARSVIEKMTRIRAGG